MTCSLSAFSLLSSSTPPTLSTLPTLSTSIMPVFNLATRALIIAYKADGKTNLEIT